MHAYFALSAPVTVPELERANHRLAHALCGDLASVDGARILRPPSSWNHKHSPPAPVALIELDHARRYEIHQLVDGLDDPPGRSSGGPARRLQGRRVHFRLRGPRVVDGHEGSRLPQASRAPRRRTVAAHASFQPGTVVSARSFQCGLKFPVDEALSSSAGYLWSVRCSPKRQLTGLLGPNGAGKTTTAGMLTTRVIPTAGSAHVGSVDVIAHPALAKQLIGVVSQTNTLDRQLMVWENLYFHGRLFGMPAAESRRVADELLDRFHLTKWARASVFALSGGMAQRLMVARSILHRPAVLFMDEPTAGLDPQSRLALWEILGELHAAGQTILLTTHYMEEADRLCNRVAIMDHGKILALDTPGGLKRSVGADTIVTVNTSLTQDSYALRPQARVRPGRARAALSPVITDVPDGAHSSLVQSRRVGATPSSLSRTCLQRLGLTPGS